MSKMSLPLKNLLNVLTGSPGAGKTLWNLKQCLKRSDTSFIILEASNSTIQEHATRFKQLGGSCTIWRGFEHKCPVIQSQIPQLQMIRDYYDRNAPNLACCIICDELRLVPRHLDPYKLQFDEPERIVFAPQQYLNSTYIDRLDPDVIFADDLGDSYVLYPPIKDINDCLRFLKYNLSVSTSSHIEKICESDIENIKKWIRGLFKGSSKIPPKYLERKQMQTLFSMNPSDLLTIKDLVFTHGRQKQFAKPYLLFLFEQSTKREVWISDAHPFKPLLDKLALRYQKETGKTVNFQYKHIKSTPDPDSRVIRVLGRRHKYPKYTRGTLYNPNMLKTLDIMMLGLLDWSKAHIGDNPTYGRVLFKQSLNTFTNVDNYRGELYLGDLRGKNTLRNADVLFKLGTQSIGKKNLLREYELYFAEKPYNTDYKEIEGQGFIYNDPLLELFRQRKEPYEDYEGIYRCRPGDKATLIFNFGVVPALIYDELPVSEIRPFLNEHGGYDWVEQDDYHAFIMSQFKHKNDVLTYNEIYKLRKAINSFKHRQKVYEKLDTFCKVHPNYERHSKRTGKRGRPSYSIKKVG